MLSDYYQENFDRLDVAKAGWASLYYGVFSKVINDNNYKTVAEIGAGFGTHAKEVMENTQVSKYYIIDPVAPYNDDFSLGIQRSQGTTDNNFDEFYDLVNDGLSDFSDKYTWIRKTSADVTVSDLKDNALDAIFIDGDHSYDAVKQDLEFSWAKVKSGGAILGDDYWIHTVAQAVTDFATENDLTVEFLDNGSGYQVYKIDVKK